MLCFALPAMFVLNIAILSFEFPVGKFFTSAVHFFLENLSQTVETNSLFLSWCYSALAVCLFWTLGLNKHLIMKANFATRFVQRKYAFKIGQKYNFSSSFSKFEFFLQTNTLCANVFSYLCFLFASCRTKESFAARSFICSDTAAFREDVKEGCFERKATTKEKIQLTKERQPLKKSHNLPKKGTHYRKDRAYQRKTAKKETTNRSVKRPAKETWKKEETQERTFFTVSWMWLQALTSASDQRILGYIFNEICLFAVLTLAAFARGYFVNSIVSAATNICDSKF